MVGRSRVRTTATSSRPIPAETLVSRGRRPIRELEAESQNGNPGLLAFMNMDQNSKHHPRMPVSVFRLIGFCMGLAAFSINTQMVEGLPPVQDGDSGLSRCLAETRIDVTANPSTVTLGQSSVVRWSVGLPNGCAVTQIRFNGQSVAPSGHRSVTPPRSSLFTIAVGETRAGTYGETSNSVAVEVGYPPRIVINPSTPAPVQVLIGALVYSNNPGQTVELCDVDLDLTGFSDLTIGDNRTLIGSPGCERTARRLGPRIFVTDQRGSLPLFRIRGDNVRFSGFRLEGPTSYMAQGDRKEKGMLIDPFASPTPIFNIEISNMEIFHWSGLGIQVIDNVEKATRGRLFNTNPGAVRIKDSFFHDNRHGAGDGYGVESAGGAYATIEQNVFDNNRHAIAGGSRNLDALDYSGYTVRDNLILPTGGVHCADSTGTGEVIGGVIGGIVGFVVGGPFGALVGAGIGAGAGGVAGSWCWQTHQIDMHGDQNRWYSSRNWQCGTAGETIIIERNTILYTKGAAIKIRGNPADKAVVDGNLFKNGSRDDAILQNGYCGYGDNITNPIDVRSNNVFGLDRDPTTELGHCDFFGDGKQDDFMATGVTWWARSPVTGQWRYLNTMKERLSQLQLGDIDHDGVCDVAIRPPRPEMRPQTYSKSGTGPWAPVLVIIH
jgi:uncharacterized protein YcfJ